MYNAHKSLSTKLLYCILFILFLVICNFPVAAEENYGNIPSDPNDPNIMGMSFLESIDLPFDPNDYTFLVFNPGGTQSRIIAAMEILGITFDERGPGNEVTLEDLETHDIMIVGWNDDGNTAGLNENVLAGGITGRVILSGHDLDYHTADPYNPIPAAQTMLVQAIDWVLKGDGTGLITLGCTDAFPYLPEFWDVHADANSVGEDVTEFTAEGLASGVYDDLEPNDMDNWGTSYHDIFIIGQGSLFVPFELGGFSGGDIITIACDKIKFPCFYIYKEVNDVNCAYPWNEIDENYLIYNISYDANGFADTNVIITDHLPSDVNYISSDPCGVYDSNWHTVTWDINDISASDSNTFSIQVGVNYYARPGDTITNFCEMEGDRYYAFTTWPTDICCYGGDIIYVDANANGFNNGTSWLHAYKDLQEALAGAPNCDCEQIRVAQQTYMPTDIEDTSARSISFELLDGAAVYGGFPPGGGTWPQRNPNVYETILSGDIGTPDNKYDDSYHVIKCVDVNNATLDGFIITAGMANGSGDDGYGGGIYCKDSYGLILRNCSISLNSSISGGALFNYSCDTNITNCILFENEATNGNGGGIYNCYQPSPRIANCLLIGNTSTLYDGGGIYNYQSSPTIINSTLSINSAGNSGGGMGNWNSSPTLTNCAFNDNSANYGGAISNKNSSDPNITNCIFAGNNANNNGGGMHNYNESSVIIADCIFTGNSTVNHGGAVYNEKSTVEVKNSIFAGNGANDYGGGILNYYNSDATVVNSIFAGNHAGDNGGGIANYYNYNRCFEITNCTFVENSSSCGGGIWCWYFADANLTNCIFWNNIIDQIRNDSNTCSLSVTYSDVMGGWSGEGNINEDPCFFDVEQSGSWSANASYDESTFQSTLTDDSASWAVNELAGRFVNPYTNQTLQFFIVSNDVNTIKVWSDINSIAGYGDTYQIYDYHLTADSNCIDAGDPDFNPGPNMKDIDGERRVFDGDDNGTEIVDIGADEYYWSPADFNSDGLVNFFDYALLSSAWLTDPNKQYYNEICDLVDNDRIDSNDLARFCEDWLWQTAWAKTFPFSYEKMGCSMGESLGLTQELFPSVSSKQEQPELTAVDIEEIIKWLEDLWLTNEEVRKIISEDDWLKFIELVKDSI